jgi:hypothetical protein
LLELNNKKIIPATWEVEIRKITVQGQLNQKISETPCQPVSQVYWYIPVIPAKWLEAGSRQKCETLKNKLNQKRTGCVTQEAVCLPSKCEALSPNLPVFKKKN